MAQAVKYPPMPRPNELTQFFWDSTKAHKLSFLRCQDCKHFVHYPRPFCSKCQSENLKPEEVSGLGTLYAYTFSPHAFHPYFAQQLPYTVAIVEMKEQPGLRMTTNLVDVPEEELRVGLPVKVVWKDLSPEVTLPLFTKA